MSDDRLGQIEARRNGLIMVGGRQTGRTALAQVLRDHAWLVEQVRQRDEVIERVQSIIDDFYRDEKGSLPLTEVPWRIRAALDGDQG